MRFFACSDAKGAQRGGKAAFLQPRRNKRRTSARGLGVSTDGSLRQGYNRVFGAIPMRLLGKALTFDDVLLVPAFSQVLPKDTSLSTQFSRNIRLNLPLVSAAM